MFVYICEGNALGKAYSACFRCGFARCSTSSLHAGMKICTRPIKYHLTNKVSSLAVAKARTARGRAHATRNRCKKNLSRDYAGFLAHELYDSPLHERAEDTRVILDHHFADYPPIHAIDMRTVKQKSSALHGHLLQSNEIGDSLSLRNCAMDLETSLPPHDLQFILSTGLLKPVCYVFRETCNCKCSVNGDEGGTPWYTFALVCDVSCESNFKVGMHVR